MNDYNPRIISYYLPSEDELEENYGMAIEDLYIAKDCATCKKFNGNYKAHCKDLKLDKGNSVCYVWRGLIEDR